MRRPIKSISANSSVIEETPISSSNFGQNGSISPLPVEKKYKFLGSKNFTLRNISIKEIEKDNKKYPQSSTTLNQANNRKEIDRTTANTDIRIGSHETISAHRENKIQMTGTIPRHTGDLEIDISADTNTLPNEQINSKHTSGKKEILELTPEEKMFKIKERAGLLECIEYKFPYNLPAGQNSAQDNDVANSRNRQYSSARPRR